MNICHFLLSPCIFNISTKILLLILRVLKIIARIPRIRSIRNFLFHRPHSYLYKKKVNVDNDKVDDFSDEDADDKRPAQRRRKKKKRETSVRWSLPTGYLEHGRSVPSAPSHRGRGHANVLCRRFQTRIEPNEGDVEEKSRKTARRAFVNLLRRNGIDHEGMFREIVRGSSW